VAYSLSSRKRQRQNEKRRARNRQRRSQLRTALRGFKSALTSGDSDQAETAFRYYAKRLDQIAAKGTVHANAAARRKARAQRRLNLLKASGK
jgi:small subunit ribosomal protein S20